jgi:hypothetical protein
LSSFQWPIDKDVSIRQLGVLLITLKVVGTRKSSFTGQTTSRDIHIRGPKKTLWSTSAAANFPCRNDDTRVLNQACREIFLKECGVAASKPFLEITWRLRSLCHHGDEKILVPRLAVTFAYHICDRSCLLLLARAIARCGSPDIFTRIPDIVKIHLMWKTGLSYLVKISGNTEVCGRNIDRR